MPRVDAEVVGSGPNGLAAAIVLAQAGWRVRVREAMDVAGGGTRTAERTLPGFQHDVSSAVHPLALSSPFFRSLPLAEHGLEWVHPDACLAHPLDDGRVALLERSIDATCETLGSDADAWRRLVGPWVPRWGHLAADVLGPLTRPDHPLLLARAPGFSRHILTRRVFSPADLERHDPYLVGGDISAGVMDLRQLFFRPVARRIPYETPLKRVYLCSASTPPGGAVHGMCGYYAARAVLGPASSAGATAWIAGLTSRCILSCVKYGRRFPIPAGRGSGAPRQRAEAAADACLRADRLEVAQRVRDAYLELSRPRLVIEELLRQPGPDLLARSSTVVRGRRAFQREGAAARRQLHPLGPRGAYRSGTRLNVCSAGRRAVSL